VTNSHHAARVVRLEGGCNFRDVGGYKTRDGRTTRHGRVYRAGVLTYFTADDHAILNRLGVRAICDLRRDDERTREPTRWPDASVQGLAWGDSENMPTIRGMYAKYPEGAASMRRAMLDLYSALPAWMGPRIAGLCQSIASGQLPMVVHCAAGKDRTGVAIAVLLDALGVDRETIVNDYLLTNEVGSFEQFIATRVDSHLGLADAHRPLFSMPEDIRKVLFAADASYLAAALARIDQEFGGTESYLTNYVGIDAATQTAIRRALLD
jgi:protein-tyrosine phosphatase